MSDETMRWPAGGDELLDVDEDLAVALTAQGEPGVRALGLLRDARRILVGTGLERPDEITESCLRGPADALLSLAGRPGRARGLEVRGCRPAGRRPHLPDCRRRRPGRTGRRRARGKHAVCRRCRPGCRAPHTGRPVGPHVRRRAAGVEEARERMRATAEVLRGQLVRPGGYHRGRAAGIAERLMGVKLGAAQEEALGVWGEMNGKTSGTLHGAAAEVGRAARLYAEVLAAARELLVPLPGRAARVLELTALIRPGSEHVLELARWADPRATAFFFRSRPASAWLALLQEHAPHLLLPDGPAGGAWPAAAFLEHLAATDPQATGAWLAEHAETVAAAGRPALNVLLGLASRDTSVIPPALVRTLLARQAAAHPAREPAGWQEGQTLRLAAEWAVADSKGSNPSCSITR
ncbi:hypothetical protein [Streptomyces sp. NPDC001811]